VTSEFSKKNLNDEFFFNFIIESTNTKKKWKDKEGSA
jgi:hypothetical protein